MSESTTDTQVECLVCGESFDPTEAGGWCTNPECGEWRYEGPEVPQPDDAADDSAADVADEGDADLESDEDGPLGDLTDADLEEGSGDADASAGDDRGDGIDADANGEADAEDSPKEDAGDMDGADASAEADADGVASPEGGAVADDMNTDSDVDAAGTAGDDAGMAPDATGGDAASTDEDATSTDENAASTDEEATPADEAPSADAEREAATEAPSDGETGEGETIDCPDCGASLAPDVNFCSQCGTDVSDLPIEGLSACPSCGADVDDDDNFCASCGEDLAARREDDAGETAPEGTSPEDDEVAPAAGEAGATTEAEDLPESLVLEVRGGEIDVSDGDAVGKQVRTAITDAGGSEEEALKVHREHVRIVRESDGFYVVDLGDNPTNVAGQRLTKGERAKIERGDTISLSGVATLTVRYP
ncbi:MAG: zinc ribbon domain-containing protein [Haloarculaceae archaeon]